MKNIDISMNNVIYTFSMPIFTILKRIKHEFMQSECACTFEEHCAR